MCYYFEWAHITLSRQIFSFYYQMLILKATKAFDILKDWYSAEDPTSGSRAGKGKGC